jgi:hypothetical protein
MSSSLNIDKAQYFMLLSIFYTDFNCNFRMKNLPYKTACTNVLPEDAP